MLGYNGLCARGVVTANKFIKLYKQYVLICLNLPKLLSQTYKNINSKRNRKELKAHIMRLVYQIIHFSLTAFSDSCPLEGRRIKQADEHSLKIRLCVRQTVCVSKVLTSSRGSTESRVHH